MNKFLICTPGRTASTSLFNYIAASLREMDPNVAAVDRGSYTTEEIQSFNTSQSAVFTMFNGFKLPHILESINVNDWNLILLTRKDTAAWLLSMIAIHSTNEWHPGKEYQVDSFNTSKEIFLYTYWGIKCWNKLVYSPAHGLGFNKVIEIDFNDLVADWPAAGRTINNWKWDEEPSKMKLGMTTSWNAVANLEEVLSWLPKEDTQLIDQIRSTL
ncbi:hypothetical protein UFOVP181_181 [uncultured Caudovirales phage]|uniref:Uncharacterized protein n=1 Tax=uncultured Caudovirales phage TaxID=2100421 RepID=A0A6J7WKY1_9CAUD|nr:hypothetical protein UFOVP57_458 [uncultured Caudovirales phage]CAB5208792.1 hypothetical protein UFOVP181_181 [uncultured Caudovirales phage]